MRIVSYSDWEKAVYIDGELVGSALSLGDGWGAWAGGVSVGRGFSSLLGAVKAIRSYVEK